MLLNIGHLNKKNVDHRSFEQNHSTNWTSHIGCSKGRDSGSMGRRRTRRKLARCVSPFPRSFLWEKEGRINSRLLATVDLTTALSLLNLQIVLHEYHLLFCCIKASLGHDVTTKLKVILTQSNEAIYRISPRSRKMKLQSAGQKGRSRGEGAELWEEIFVFGYWHSKVQTNPFNLVHSAIHFHHVLRSQSVLWVTRPLNKCSWTTAFEHVIWTELRNDFTKCTSI